MVDILDQYAAIHKDHRDLQETGWRGISLYSTKGKSKYSTLERIKP